MYKHNLVLRKRLLSLRLSSSRVRGLEKFSPSRAVSQWSKFCVASCHCIAHCPCFVSCNCCHDPFIVRSAQTCPPFTGFTQLAHPSRCSRSTLTKCLFLSSCFSLGLCVHIGLATRYQIHHRLTSLHRVEGVGSLVSRIPILQTWNVVVVQEQRLASFQHLRRSSP